MADWNIDEGGKLKQILQDIEESSYDLDDINLQYLTEVNPRFYGPERNGTEEDKAKRRKISNKLTDLKRMRRNSAIRYRDHVIENGVTPSARTIAHAKADQDALSGSFARMSMQQRPTPPPNTPPRHGLSFAASPPRSTGMPSPFGTTPFLVPSVPSTVYSMDASSTTSSVLPSDISSFGEMAEAQLQGMLYKPNVIPVDLDNFERHLNGYYVNLINDQPVGGNECVAVMVWKQFNAPDIQANEATLPSGEYLTIVSSLGNYAYPLHRQCMLIKYPSIPFGDKHDEDGPNKIQFPDDACGQAVMSAQGNLDQSRAFKYDLLVFPENVFFDNRVLSNDDSIVNADHSLPNSFKDPDIEDHVLFWHSFWRVAIKGTTRKTKTQKRMSIKQMKELNKKKKAGN